MNHAAVRSVSLRTLNRQRANIVFSEYLDSKRVPTPRDVSAQERIFEWDGALRWRGCSPIGKAKVGVSLQDLLKPWAEAHAVTSALRDDNFLLPRLLDIFRDEGYLLWYDCPNRVAWVVLKSSASPQDQVKAWTHALLMAHRLKNQRLATSASPDKVLEVLQGVRVELSSMWATYMEQVDLAGWDLNIANIETSSGLRLYLKHE